MEDAGQAKSDPETRNTLSELPGDVVLDCEPEYCAKWTKLNVEWKQRQYKMEWSSSRIVGFGKNKDAMEAIYKLMECSLCFKTCPYESKACDDGHMICPNCAYQVNFCCPLLTVNEFGTSISCLANVSMESILPIYDQLFEVLLDEGIVIRCENQTLGCPESMPQEQLWSHQSKCQFRPEFACSFDDCFVGGLTGPQLIEHLVQFHKIPVFTDNPMINKLGFKKLPADTKSYSWTLAIFFHNNIHFLLCMAQQEDKIYMWVSTVEEEFKDKYSIKISPKDINGMISRSPEVVPLPFQLPNSQVIQNRKGVIDYELKSFMQDYVQTTSGREEEGAAGDGHDGMATTNFIKVEIFIQTENEKREAYLSNFPRC